MWLVTIRCGINFLLGDLVTHTTIQIQPAGARVIRFCYILGKTRIEILGPVCRARRADHLSAEILRVIVFKHRRLPLFVLISGRTDNDDLREVKLSFFSS